MSFSARSLLSSLKWIAPYGIAVLIWLGVTAWQIIPYSARLYGYDSANPGGVPLQAMGCPLYAYSKVGVRVEIPEPAGQQIVYKTNFSIIPADVSQGFEPLCAPLATGTPPNPARALCFFDLPNLKSADSGAWFLSVTAGQNVSGTAALTNLYSGVCLIRTQAALTQDLIVAGVVILTGLLLLIAATFLWPRSGMLGKVVVVITVPVIWYVGSLAAGLTLAGNSEWLYFAIGLILIAAIIALRAWLSTRKKGVA